MSTLTWEVNMITESTKKDMLTYMSGFKRFHRTDIIIY